MPRFRLFLQAAVGMGFLIPAAQASIITTPTQTLTFGPQKTEFGGLTQPLNLFDSNLGTLQSISVRTSLGFSSLITVTNAAATSSTGTAQAEGTLILSAQNGGVNSVLQSLLNTPADPLAYGGYNSYTMDVFGTKKAYALSPNTATTVTSSALTQFKGPLSDSTTTDLLPFEVAGGGSTNLIANTFTQTNLANNGGNTSTTEATNATAAFSIFYTYDNSTATAASVTGVPEPASLAILGVGLLGMGMLRRRGNRL